MGIFGVAAFGGTGLPDSYDKIIANINTSVTSDYAGDSLCIDSSFFLTGTWRWVSSSSNIFPDWSGPHCYEILPSCCVGIRGNIDLSSDEVIDISDLVMLVDFMFLSGPEPICLEEADWDDDGVVDISELVNLVGFMHLNGSPPPPCQ